MEVGAGPGIGDAGDLAQGPDQDGTEGASGGMIGVTPGAGPGMSNAMTVEAFSKALNKVLGQQKAAQDAYYGGTIDQSQLDDPTDDSPVDDFDSDLAYGTGATVAQDTHDANLALHTGATSLGTLGPSYSTDAVEEQVYGGKKSAFEQDVNKSVNIGIEPEYDSTRNSFFSAAELEYENIMKNTAPFSKERNKALRQLNAIKSTDLYSKAYDFANPSAVRNMLAKAVGYLGMGGALSIAKALENKAIEKGLFDRTTFDQMMKEFDDPGAFAAAGNPLGTGGSEQNQRDIINKLFYEVNPWAKGLNERQINYYLDRPEELEWVRNLYNEMNPMSPSLVTPTS